MSKLEGKVAIVTDASKGIGASIARHLAAGGLFRGGVDHRRNAAHRRRPAMTGARKPVAGPDPDRA
jgi:NAD(P)-dependent dehydrogenase (short-subunit alcohol dehydrogenase family)